MRLIALGVFAAASAILGWVLIQTAQDRALTAARGWATPRLWAAEEPTYH
jgi:hypothetical protein